MGSGTPVPVDVVLEASEPPPPSFDPPVPALVVLALVVLAPEVVLALVVLAPEVVLALVVVPVLPAAPAPPPPPSPPSPPSPQAASAAMPSAIQAELQSHREERFLFTLDFPFSDWVSF
ncbi:hypothetical protein [Sorangium sp. So ce394]|uniref:hypothetical protein n=1 Tax=Sorangium sp. So ce394 TaxID=3133310 RepID=UPI003F5C05AE